MSGAPNGGDGWLSSLVRSLTPYTPVPSEADVAPELRAMIDPVRWAVAALNEEDENSIERLCSALDGALFFGLEAPTLGRREYCSADFLPAVLEADCESCRRAWAYVGTCVFVGTRQGKCRAWHRAALMLGVAPGAMRGLACPGLWRRRSVVGDPAARESLCRCLASLPPLLPRIDDPKLDRGFVAFDGAGILRLLDNTNTDHVEVTVAGDDTAHGVYNLHGSVYIHSTHRLEREDDQRWCLTRSIDGVRLYIHTHATPSPPATGWQCLSGKLPVPVVRKVKLQATSSSSSKEEDHDPWGAIVRSQENNDIPLTTTTTTTMRTLRNKPKKKKMSITLIEEDVAAEDIIDEASPVLVEDDDRTPWRIPDAPDTDDRVSRRLRIAELDENRRRRVKAARVAVDRMLQEEEKIDATMNAVIDRALQRVPAAAPEKESTETVDLAMCLARERSAPRDERAREAKVARQLWRRRCVKAARRLTSEAGVHCTEARCLGAVVVSQSYFQKKSVVWLIRLGLERGIEAFDLEDDGDDDSDDRDDDPAETYFRRLGDPRLRRPRKVAVIRCDREALEKLGDVEHLDAVEERLLRRDEGNPIGRDAMIATLADPGIRAIDRMLADASAVSLKLFLDEACSQGTATAVSLGLWQPLRAAESCAATPPPLPSMPENDDVSGRKKPAVRRMKLTFYDDESAQFAAQDRRCACCGEEAQTSILGGPVKNMAPCRLLDMLVCKKRCHDDAYRVLPWRAVSGDFAAHRVSTAAAQFLDDRQTLPLLKLPPSAPVCHLPRIDAARQLRIRLAELRVDATLHGRRGGADASRNVLAKLQDRVHLALGPDYWSLQDILDADDGTLISLLSDAIAEATEAFATAFANDQLLRDFDTHLLKDDENDEQLEPPADDSLWTNTNEVLDDDDDDDDDVPDNNDGGQEEEEGRDLDDDLSALPTPEDYGENPVHPSLDDDDDDDQGRTPLSPSSYLMKLEEDESSKNDE